MINMYVVGWKKEDITNILPVGLEAWILSCLTSTITFSVMEMQIPLGLE